MNKIDEKAAELSDLMKQELGEIELGTMEFTLADAIRRGSAVTSHQVGSYGNGATACALTAAVVAARAVGYL
jgi:hypothetical protein